MDFSDKDKVNIDLNQTTTHTISLLTEINTLLSLSTRKNVKIEPPKNIWN